ncbi:MAG: 50S ribosomal protein L3, partial [Candidatus Cloacimonetes bacterium]|nr:50S ribosomal protein L3 [Candidatus Cloacimonadota bacterium]
MLGLIGKKIGMTRAFSENGDSIPVTLVHAGPCTVVKQKTIEKDGYTALQLGFYEIDEKKMTKPQAGHFKKNNLKCFKFLREFRVDDKAL